MFSPQPSVHGCGGYISWLHNSSDGSGGVEAGCNADLLQTVALSFPWLLGIDFVTKHTVRCCQSWVATSCLTAHSYISVQDLCLLNDFRLLITTTTATTTAAFLYLRQQVTRHRLCQTGKRLWPLKQCFDSKSYRSPTDQSLFHKLRLPN